MTLDEAIKHCEEKAKEIRWQALKERMDIEGVAECETCAEEHEQLAEWLKELKGLRLLVNWAVDCDFGYDNIPDLYARYKDDIANMNYIDGLIYIAVKEAENVDT